MKRFAQALPLLVSLLLAANPVFAQAFTAGIYQENSAGIMYGGGTWASGSPSGSGTTYKYTTTNGAYYSFMFTGSQLTLFRTINPGRGESEICIDGSCSTFTSYAASLTFAAPITFNTSYGTHTVTVTKQNGEFADIDAIQVSGDAPVDPGVTPTVSNPFVTPTPWTRPTPVLWDFEESDHAAPLEFSAEDTGDFADTIIQTYHWLDQGGIISTVIFFMMSMMILGLLFKVIRRSKRI